MKRPFGWLIASTFLMALTLACGGSPSMGSSPAPLPSPTALPLPPPVEGPKALDATGLDNLVAFTKLMGYVRHFHPSDEAASANWSFAAIQGLRQVESQATPRDLANWLQGWFGTLAPTVQVFLEGESPALPSSLNPTASTQNLVNWKNLGWGLDSQELVVNPYWNNRNYVPAATPPYGFPIPSQPYEVSLPRGLRCRVPLSLCVIDTHTLPQSTQPAPYTVYASSSNNDRSTRFASLAMAWNVIQHFHPYLQDLSVDWEAELRAAFVKAAMDADAQAFTSTLGHMMSAIHDAHNVVSPSPLFAAQMPFVLDWVEGKWLVVRLLPEAPPGIAVGDEVLSCDGTELSTLWTHFSSLVSGSEQYLRTFAQRMLLNDQTLSSSLLSLKHPDGTLTNVSATRIWPYEKNGNQYLAEPRPSSPISTLAPGIAYVDITRATRADIEPQTSILQNAQVLLVDLRGYPSDDTITTMLIPKYLKVASPQLRIWTPSPLQPDHPVEFFTELDWNSLQPAVSPWPGQLVFLTDGRAFSYAESTLIVAEGAGIPILGAPSGGADGNFCQINLPGDMVTSFTGMKVLRTNGQPMYLRGVPPLVSLSRTAAGVAAGQDELLEQALAWAQAHEFASH